MKVWQRLSFCTALALVALLPAGAALAASVSGRASTQVEWFDTADGETAVPMYQYLLLNVKDIDGNGLDFRGYGRFADDIADETEFADSRLYFAFLEKNNLLDGLDLRLGRQFISTTAGASLMDGINLEYDKLGPVTLNLFGGGDVTYYEGYNAKDLIVGGEVTGQFIDSLHLGLSYVQKWDDSDLSHELIGFDLDYDQYGLFNLYSETQFSWLTDEVTYFLLGGKYYRDERWTLRAEYLYSLPVFSSTSIYSVFAVDEYEEALAELNYHFDGGIRAFARYTREFYETGSDADVLEAGVEKLRTDAFYGYLTGIIREDDDGHDLTGFKARAAYRFSQRCEAGVGIHLDVLERRLEEDDETTSTRLWADTTVFLTDSINVQAKVERVESDLWDEYYRGRVRLNIPF